MNIVCMHDVSIRVSFNCIYETAGVLLEECISGVCNELSPCFKISAFHLRDL